MKIDPDDLPVWAAVVALVIGLLLAWVIGWYFVPHDCEFNAATKVLDCPDD